ncbi:MAG: periplasmic heavy metal sensor [Chlorobiaceae bacterium]|nr:periplasmic heavy metal sensor [Chlorobiaceae bacterium]NTW74509.1 periplasmic heavy metal sensor [Chlorobiaceae bacterium]
MDFLASKRLVTSALVILAILNITLLGALWWQNFFSRNVRSVEVREYYSRNVAPSPEDAFSPEQKKKFRALRREHFQKNLPALRQIVTLKQELVDEAVKTNPDTAKISRIADLIGTRQAKLDRNLAMHFHELSSLCTPSQRDSLRLFLGKVYNRKFEHGSRWIRETRPAEGPGGPRRDAPPE